MFRFLVIKIYEQEKNLPVFVSYFPHEIHGSVKCQMKAKQGLQMRTFDLYSFSKVQTNETKRTEIAFQVINETFPFLRREPQSDLNRFLYLTQIT